MMVQSDVPEEAKLPNGKPKLSHEFWSVYRLAIMPNGGALYVKRDSVRCTLHAPRATPRHAKPPGEDIISNLEKLVVYAPTPQLRCAAGLLALLAHTSHRGLDGIRARSMQVTESAFAGESLVNTSDTWTSWVIPLSGFSGTAWPTLWMQELLDAGLPGPDYVLNGFDGYCKKWSGRCATTSGLEIAYRMLLQTPPTTSHQTLQRRCQYMALGRITLQR